MNSPENELVTGLVRKTTEEEKKQLGGHNREMFAPTPKLTMEETRMDAKGCFYLSLSLLVTSIAITIPFYILAMILNFL